MDLVMIRNEYEAKQKKLTDELHKHIKFAVNYDELIEGCESIEDIDKDGNITAANDRKILGYSDPSYRFSIQNTFRYKDFELKFLLNSIQGGKNYYWANSGSAILEPDGAYQNNMFKFDYWTPENPDAK